MQSQLFITTLGYETRAHEFNRLNHDILQVFIYHLVHSQPASKLRLYFPRSKI